MNKRRSGEASCFKASPRCENSMQQEKGRQGKRGRRTIARRQAWPLVRCRHDSERMASLAAERRGSEREKHVRQREEGTISSEMKASMMGGLWAH